MGLEIKFNHQWFDLVGHVYDATIKSLDEGFQGAFRLVKHGGSGSMAHPEGCGSSLPSLSPYSIVSSVRLSRVYLL